MRPGGLLCGAVGLIRVNLPPKQISRSSLHLCRKHTSTLVKGTYFLFRRGAGGLENKMCSEVTRGSLTFLSRKLIGIVRVQLAAGLISSSRHVVRWAGVDAVRTAAMEMAIGAVGLQKGDDPDIGDVARW